MPMIVSEGYTLGSVKQHYGGLLDCCWTEAHNNTLRRGVELLGFHEDGEDEPRPSRVGLVRLDSGEVFVVWDWEDWTGHG